MPLSTLIIKYLYVTKLTHFTYLLLYFTKTIGHSDQKIKNFRRNTKEYYSNLKMLFT
jgi:hypothetical protein